jgi:transposase-like protein
MSDREKGLPDALKAILPDAYQAYCCQHIADNVQQRFGIKCRPLFWKCARAKKLDNFKEALQALMDESVDAGNYVNSIPHASWARYCFPFARFGHDTNNIIESINNLLGDIQKLPPLQMVDALYTLCMKKVYNRFH